MIEKRTNGKEKMFSWSSPFTKDDRRKRFPIIPFISKTSETRKVGISTENINPKHLLKIIKEYHSNLSIHHLRYKWLCLWMDIISNQLNQLELYPMDDVERVVILYNETAIFDFYLHKDIHVKDPETICIQLNDFISEKSTYFGSMIQTFGLLASLGTLAFFIPNLF